MQKLCPGEKIKAVVFSNQPFGIFLRDVNHPKTDILIEVTDMGSDFSKEKIQSGAVLEIAILYVSDDGTAARATLLK